MAAISNATLVADVAENINAEFISRTVRYAAQKPYIYDQIVYKVDLNTLSTATYSEPIADELTQAGTLTATDIIAAQKTSRSDETVSVTPYGTAVFLDYETVRRSMWDEFAVAMERLVGACKRRADNTVLALASSMSNTIGDASTQHSMLNHQKVLTAWRAQVGSSGMSMPIQVMHGDALRDLGYESVTSAAALMGGAIGTNVNDVASAVRQGQTNRLGNVAVLDTDNVVAGDTTGWANFMVLNNDLEHAIAFPWEQGIEIHVEHKPERRGWYVVASTVFGAGLVNHDYALAFITRT